jgi:beta-glucanase (GH16 family)
MSSRRIFTSLLLGSAVVLTLTTMIDGRRARALAADSAAPPPGYALAPSFDEEFNGSAPTNAWGNAFVDPGTTPITAPQRTLWTNGEREIYFDKDYLKLGLNPFSVHDGMMTVTAAPMNQATKAAVNAELNGIPQFSNNAVLRNVAFTSGMLTQRGRFVQQYGYFETRMRWTAGNGIWPGFWLLRQDSHWPPEIDIMEAVGKDPKAVFSSTHSAVAPNDTTLRVPLTGSPQDFHRYGALWLPDRIDYYVDGVKTVSLPTHTDMNQPMYMLLNLAIGGNWPGNPDASTVNPAKMDIDYVRAWKFVGPPPTTGP